MIGELPVAYPSKVIENVLLKFKLLEFISTFNDLPYIRSVVYPSYPSYDFEKSKCFGANIFEFTELNA